MGRSTLEENELTLLLPDENGAQNTTELLQQSVASAVACFNDGQKAVFNTVVASILPGVSSSDLSTPVVIQSGSSISQPRVFFLDAPGGTGKTFVTRALHGFLRVRRKKVIPVATETRSTSCVP